MRISFKAIGVDFDALVDYDPGQESTPAAEAVPSTCEIKGLWSGVYSCHFLLISDIANQIIDAAHERADACWVPFGEPKSASKQGGQDWDYMHELVHGAGA